MGEPAEELRDSDTEPNTIVGYQCEQRLLAVLYKSGGFVALQNIDRTQPFPKKLGGTLLRRLQRFMAVEYGVGTVNTCVLQLEKKALVTVDRYNRGLCGVYMTDAEQRPPEWAMEELSKAMLLRNELGEKAKREKATKGNYVKPPAEWKDEAVRYEYEGQHPHGATTRPQLPETHGDTQALARALLREALTAITLMDEHECAPATDTAELAHWQSEAERLHQAAQSAENRLARYRDEARQANEDLAATKRALEQERKKVAQLESNVETAVATARDMKTALDAQNRQLTQMKRRLREYETSEHTTKLNDVLTPEEQAALDRLKRQVERAKGES